MRNPLPTATVIVPTYQQETTLEKCIISLLQQDYKGDYSIIVVDNSEAFLLDDLRRKYPQIQFMWQPKPGSYAARNKAIDSVQTDIVAFTDSDCVADKSWLSNAAEALRSNPSLGYVGGLIAVFARNPENPTLTEQFEMIFEFDQKTCIEIASFSATANMITRKDTLDKVGKFNDNLKSGGDMDWGQRATKMGLPGKYFPNIVMNHPARTYGEAVRKIHRCIGGKRDIYPGWKNCLRFAYRSLRPPRRRIMHILSMENPSFSMWDKVKLAAYCVWLTWYEAYYRVKIEFFKSPSVR